MRPTTKYSTIRLRAFVAIAVAAATVVAVVAPSGSYAASTSIALLKPVADNAASNVQAVVAGAASTSNLWQAVDDSTSFNGSDNDASHVETVGGQPGVHDVAYSDATPGSVSRVVANVRARRASTPGSIKVLLYDGTKVIGTGPTHSLGSSYKNFSDTFSGLSVANGSTLHTSVQLNSPSGVAMYTEIWLSATHVTPSTSSTSTTAAPSTTSTSTTVPTNGATSVSDLLTRTDLIYGSEIGAWQTTGAPATDPTTGIPSLVKAAKIPLMRFANYDVFTDETDPQGNPGTQSRANFDTALDTIHSNLGAEVTIKLMPISNDVIGTKNGTIYCPPLNNLTQNLDYYKAIVAQAGSRVRIYESSNEMEYDCYQKWGFASSGSTGVSTVLGKHFAQNMPALKKYARSLGFNIVTVGYIGTPGGFGWGDTIANPRVSTATEFLTATHDAYVASGYDPDYIPDVISIHAYPYSPDFGFNASLSDIIAYYESWQTKVQAQINSIWGAAGASIKFAVSEWNAGSKDWTGFNDSRVSDFYTAWMAMLKRDHYWLADQFATASNAGEPYDIITKSGTTAPQYGAFKTASVNGQA